VLSKPTQKKLGAIKTHKEKAFRREKLSAIKTHQGKKIRCYQNPQRKF
jgi:hypothetical protein